MISKFMSAWLHPFTTLNDLKAEGEGASIKSSMMFIVVMGVLGGVIASVMGMAFPPANIVSGEVPKWSLWLMIPVIPVASFLGSFIGAAVLWGLVSGLIKGSSSEYKTCYRILALIAAFSPVSALFSPIPKIGSYLAIAINIWAVIVMIQGLVIVMDTKAIRTWIVCGFVFGLLLLLTLYARVTAGNPMRAASAYPQFDTRGTAMGDEELGLGEESLDKKLQSLAEKAKAPAAEAEKK